MGVVNYIVRGNNYTVQNRTIMYNRIKCSDKNC